MHPLSMYGFIRKNKAMATDVRKKSDSGGRRKEEEKEENDMRS